jgi:hypothetical protein
MSLKRETQTRSLFLSPWWTVPEITNQPRMDANNTGYVLWLRLSFYSRLFACIRGCSKVAVKIRLAVVQRFTS